MTEIFCIFCLERTVQPVCWPPLPSVYHGYWFWSAILPGDIQRFSTSTWRIDPFVLALSIHRVIRKVTFDSSLPRKRSVSKTTNSAITHKTVSTPRSWEICENQTRKKPTTRLIPL
ncbi:hypothetical protein BDQ94DRAFT_155593, partial [Aspergillus welwitschiae]